MVGAMSTPSTDWKETIAADEPERFERLGNQLLDPVPTS